MICVWPSLHLRYGLMGRPTGPISGGQFWPCGCARVGVAVALRMIENADRAMLAEALTQAPKGVGPAALIGLAQLCRILENAATKAATD